MLPYRSQACSFSADLQKRILVCKKLAFVSNLQPQKALLSSFKNSFILSFAHRKDNFDSNVLLSFLTAVKIKKIKYI